MSVYYNEINPKAAAWIRQLIKEGHIADGVVDERSIEDVIPSDLTGFVQCHFFAGIGGWSHALRRAGWPDDKPCWTGSCPCQPFSSSGEGLGFDDPRHLWPAFEWHIRNMHPPVVFGEQVATALVDPWIDIVSDELEDMGYRVGAFAFPAAGVGAPHLRDRCYWVADAGVPLERSKAKSADHVRQVRDGYASHPGGRVLLDGVVADAVGKSPAPVGNGTRPRDAGRSGALVWKDDRSAPTHGFWGHADWISCRDGRYRPVEPGTFPLADGVSARVDLLTGYGNAIVPEAAEAFIRSYLEATE